MKITQTRNDLPELMFFDSRGNITKEIKVIPKSSPYYSPRFLKCKKCHRNFERPKGSSRKRVLCPLCSAQGNQYSNYIKKTGGI